MLKCRNRSCQGDGIFERREYVRHVMIVGPDDQPVDDSGVVDIDEALGERTYRCCSCGGYDVVWESRKEQSRGR